MEKYNHKKIEKKWQEKWEKDEPYKAEDGLDKEKFYALIEFPYPSGDGLHVGHPRPYIGMDVIARKRRAEGFNVLYPIGWDAFGLPTENYAIKTGIHPKVVTKNNTDNFRRQIKSLGISFDWSREINTTDPEYYKWTQWIFLQLFKHGLAYKASVAINWCLSCKTGLANEEVIDEECERCGGKTEKRQKEQWMLAITKYADCLDKDLDTVDYTESIKIQQRNWIGKSEGAEIEFRILNLESRIKVFTTRPDTLFGATYLVLSPEHKLVAELLANNEFPNTKAKLGTGQARIKNHEEVAKYINDTKKKTDIERTADNKDLPAGEAGKTGVELKGVKAINPATKEEIPIFVADYVLADYGTGAIMAVPAHDERDFEFAKKFNLKIEPVISPMFNANPEYSKKHSEQEKIIEFIEDVRKGKRCLTESGYLVNSGRFTDMHSVEAKEKITKFVGGELKTTYKLRDWVFSRQRYWGEPIPLVFCEACKKQAENSNPNKLQATSYKLNKGELLNPGWFAIDEKDLPLELPEVENYQPTDTGESPLANVKDWVNVKCPKCEGEAKRETDTMPNWAGSSWYHLAYIMKGDPKFKIQNSKFYKHWLPVDWYNGGMEHTTLHLLYSRFWHKFLYDIGVVPTIEPYQKRTSHGLILAEGGEKMSKSKGNVINPDEIVERFGADTLRVYEMFMGPFDQPIEWSTDNMVGARRFLEKVWRLQEKVIKDSKFKIPKADSVSWARQNSKFNSLLHKTIKKVSEDIEAMKFNTAISAMMIFVNEMEKEKEIPSDVFSKFLILLNPFAPHIAGELWEKIGNNSSILNEKWPQYDGTKIQQDSYTIVAQVNGKTRASVEVDANLKEDEIKSIVLDNENVKKWIDGKEIKRVVYVENKLINVVV